MGLDRGVSRDWRFDQTTNVAGWLASKDGDDAGGATAYVQLREIATAAARQVLQRVRHRVNESDCEDLAADLLTSLLSTGERSLRATAEARPGLTLYAWCVGVIRHLAAREHALQPKSTPAIPARGGRPRQRAEGPVDDDGSTDGTDGAPRIRSVICSFDCFWP